MESFPITGAILAGGPNAGMGGALKALLPLEGETLIERQIREMRKVCSEIIVVTNTPKPFFQVLDSYVRLITDYFPDGGPLGGMHSALYLARHPLVWVSGCDMPFLSAAAAKRLAENRKDNVQAVVPILDGMPVVLHGVYDKRCAESAAKLLSSGEKGLEAFLGRIRWQGMEADHWMVEGAAGRFDFTIHRPEEYALAKESLTRRLTTGSSRGRESV